jgi:hypothetical protein
MALIAGGWRGLATDGWKAVLYVVLIILCVLMASEEPLRFVYTEF